MSGRAASFFAQIGQVTDKNKYNKQNSNVTDQSTSQQVKPMKQAQIPQEIGVLRKLNNKDGD